MRVPVRTMRGDYIHPTTPRKARIFLKEWKEFVDSNNPFTIRLKYQTGEVGLKELQTKENRTDTSLSVFLNKEKQLEENIMCDEGSVTDGIIKPNKNNNTLNLYDLNLDFLSIKNFV